MQGEAYSVNVAPSVVSRAEEITHWLTREGGAGAATTFRVRLARAIE